jgi:hypothetical protein
VLTIMGSLLTLSACGKSVPAVVATYKVTFVPTSISGVNDIYVDPEYSLVLSQHGHFVMTPSDHADVTFKGTWRKSGGQLMLNTPKVQFIALVKGRDLRMGEMFSFGGTPTFTTWSAVGT